MSIYRNNKRNRADAAKLARLATYEAFARLRLPMARRARVGPRENDDDLDDEAPISVDSAIQLSMRAVYG
jgi:hypothetical protein